MIRDTAADIWKMPARDIKLLQILKKYLKLSF